jgi:hypothetical protein
MPCLSGWWALEQQAKERAAPVQCREVDSGDAGAADGRRERRPARFVVPVRAQEAAAAELSKRVSEERAM